MQLSNVVDAARGQQTTAAAERYRDNSPRREANERERAGTGLTVLDSPEQVEARAARLLQQGEVTLEAVVEAARSDTGDRPQLLERIIGASKDFQAVSFLARGSRAAAAVARISMAQGGREIPLGTGFLVSPRLLMTNNHVLPDEEAAQRVLIEFGAQVGIDNLPATPVRHQLDPTTLFLTDRLLDFTLVAVRPADDGTRPGDRFGWNPLVLQQGKIVIGEPVNIIGHPMGRLMEISIRNNRLSSQLDDFLHYETDTEPGNSGSPVFNDQWEIVALHHSGVPRTNEKGRFLRHDGRVWKPGDGDDAVDWVANEGVRVSVMLRHLAELETTESQRAVLAEMGPQSGLAGAVDGAVVAAPGPVAPVTPEAAAAVVAAAATAGVGAIETAGRSGVTGRLVTGRAAQIVFLHGRGQQGRDPADLRRTWAAGLNQGLTRAGLPPVDPDGAYFPYYGDVLVEGLQDREAAMLPAEDWRTDPAAAVAPAAPSTRRIYEEMLDEAARRAGMPALEPGETAEEGLVGRITGGLVGSLRSRLGWLAARSGLDDLTISLVFRDVAAYLDDQQLRKSVLHAVQETLPPAGTVVLVSHSLGTVVAMDLLSELPAGLRVGLLVTAGSPLGMDSVYRRLLVGKPQRPDVDRWTNVWSAADAVAIGCPLARTWAGQLEELLVDNPKDRAHSIEEYLGHAPVAAAISDGLGR
jgi:V8-like Glu-specific endopeptidase